MPRERKEIVFPRFSIFFGVVVPVVALVLTIVGVYFMVRAEKTEVAAQVLSCGELTKYSPIAELKGHFTYAGEDVAYLWKLTVKFVNSGDKTIVGEGNQKNIIGEGINFMFPDNTRILKVEEEANTFQSTIMQPEPNQLQIRFRQWRSGEYSIKSFYVASDKPLYTDPLPAAPTRDIVDGDILVEDLTQRGPAERRSLIDYLPRAVSTPAKVIGGISAGGLALTFIIVLALAWRGTVKKAMWKRRYLPSFAIYLDQVEPKISKSRKKLYRENPEILPDELWANFKGKKASWGMDFDDKPTATVITLILIFLVLGLSCLTLMLFPV